MAVHEQATVGQLRLTAFVARIALVAVASCLVLWALTAAIVPISASLYDARVRSAAQAGVLSRGSPALLDRTVTVVRNNFNDCLILSMLLVPGRDSRAAQIISPRIPAFDDISPVSPAAAGLSLPDHLHCRNLARTLIATAQGNAAAAVPSDYYHRYLHGDRTLAAIMLAVMPVAAATSLLAALLIALLVALALLPLRTMLGAGKLAGERPRAAAYTAIALCLLLFWGLPNYAWSFSFAPSDIVLTLFLLTCFRQPIDRLPETRLVSRCALFGAVTMIFEFLTGALPAGLSAILLAFAIEASTRATFTRDDARKVMLACAAFTAAAVLCFLLKIAAVALVLGAEGTRDFGPQLTRHMGNVDWDIDASKLASLARFGIDAESFKHSRALTTVYAFYWLGNWSTIIAHGSKALGLAIVFLVPLALVAGTAPTLVRAIRHREVEERAGILLVCAAGLVTIAWYVVFPQHTAQHANMMVRLAVWPLAALAAAAAWTIARARIEKDAASLAEGNDDR